MKRLHTALIALVFIGAISCDLALLEEAVDNFAPVIALEPINTTGVVQIVDAATGELVTGRVEVTFTPPQGGQVIDIYSDPFTNVAVTNGFVNFGISNNVEPSDNNPATVSITYSASGYLPRTQTVNLTAPGSSDFVVRLVRESNPPAGIVLATSNAGTTSATGETATELSIRPSGTAGTAVTEESPETEVVIPAGSILLDASGNPLSGQLTARTQFYDTSVPDAMDGLPDDIQTLAREENALILVAADMSITDASGRRATSLGGGAASKRGPNGEVLSGNEYTLVFTLPVSRMNIFNFLVLRIQRDGSSTEALKLADIVSDRLTNVPAEGRPGFREIRIRVPGDLPAGFSIIANIAGGVVLEGTIAVERNGNTGALNYEAFSTGTRVSGRMRAEQNSVNLSGFFALDYRVRVWNAVTEGVIESHSFSQTTRATVNLPAPPPSVIDAQIELVLQCSDPTLKVRVDGIPGASVFYKKVGGSGDWRAGTDLDFNYNPDTQALEGGEVTLRQVEQGSTYDVKLLYNTEEESGQIEITGNRVVYTETIDADICG